MRSFPSFCHRPPHLLHTVRRPCLLKTRFCLRFVRSFMSSENLQINSRTPLSVHSTPIEGRFSTRKKEPLPRHADNTPMTCSYKNPVLMRLIFYPAANGVPICSVYAKKHLIYVYLCKPSPQIRAEASTRMSVRRLIRLLFNSKRGDYPYFLPLTISYILHVRL